VGTEKASEERTDMVDGTNEQEEGDGTGEREEVIPYYRPPSLTAEDRASLNRDIYDILSSGQYTKGELASHLATIIAMRAKYDHAIPLAQATHGIMILARWFRSRGYRKIRVPAFTWPSSYMPFVWLGDHVRFVDIDPKTWLADFGDLKPDTDELEIPVDTFGNVFRENDNDHPFVDSAQSFGSEWDSTLPTRVISLSASKILTSGEGGILLTQDEHLARFAQDAAGWFSRMPEMSAAVGLANLRVFDSVLARKKIIAETYRKTLPLAWQEIPHSTNHYIVAATVPSPKDIRKKNPGWEYRDYYQSIVSEKDEPTPIETMPENGSLKVTREVSRHIIAFPAYPDMDVSKIREMKA